MGNGKWGQVQPSQHLGHQPFSFAICHLPFAFAFALALVMRDAW
jgi:hypothetical protein